jgi:dCMP deaminase
MRHVYLIGSKSKDDSTQIGAILVSDGGVISEGYNGICRKVNDMLPERNARPYKYSFYEHGERNSIYNAARKGIKTMDSIMYTNSIPCTDCGRAVIQAGCSEIVLHKQWEDIWRNIKNIKWEGHDNTTLTMFEEAGVKVRFFDKLLGINCLISEQLVEV